MRSIFSFLFFILSLNVNVPAQFGKDDSLLLHKTFAREWSDKIFSEYLTSDEPKKINAALLAVSHSADTSFVQSIIAIQNKDCEKYIFFALGQIGYSFQSSEYLRKRIAANNSAEIYFAFEALGKIGTRDDFEKLKIHIQSHGVASGVPNSVMNFALRGMKDSSLTQVLWSSIFVSKDYSLIKEISFALYRMRENFSDAAPLEKLLEKLSKSDGSATASQYLLGIFRNSKSFPVSEQLFTKLISSDDWIIRNEIASAGIFFPFQNEMQLENYLKLLDDANPNVQRTCAASLKRISLSDELKLIFISKIENNISTKKYSAHVSGELASSLIRLSADKQSLLEKQKEFLTKEYVARVLGEFSEFDSSSYDELINIFESGNIKEKIEAVTSFTKIYTRTKSDVVRKFIFERLSSPLPPLVSIAADNIDSATIKTHESELASLITDYIVKKLDSAEHLEALLSLYNLAGKISSDFQSEIKNYFAASNLFSLKKIAIPKATKRPENFGQIWSEAFKYSAAEILTSKGKITLQLMSELAPITVANFILLAENNFYDGVSFHRVVPAFVIQGGDPSGSGWGGCGYEIISEFSPENYSAGVAGIASAGKDTEGSQWFIMQAEHMHLNGRYTVWGKIISGQAIVDNIEQYDLILSIKFH